MFMNKENLTRDDPKGTADFNVNAHVYIRSSFLREFEPMATEASRPQAFKNQPTSLEPWGGCHQLHVDVRSIAFPCFALICIFPFYVWFLLLMARGVDCVVLNPDSS